MLGAGAVYINQGTVTMIACSVTGNTARSGGAAFYIHSDAPTPALFLVNMNTVQSDVIGGTPSKLATCNNLATLCTHLLQENGLLRHYRLDALVVRKFFYLVEQASYYKIIYYWKISFFS